MHGHQNTNLAMSLFFTVFCAQVEDFRDTFLTDILEKNGVMKTIHMHSG
jgi:hypothetical protein